MPLGIRRCFVQHSSDNNNTEGTYTFAKDSGYQHSSIESVTSHKCGDSVTWKPYSKEAESFLSDTQCAVKLSIPRMYFFCCCYSQGLPCDIGLIAADGLTCPHLSVSASHRFHEDQRLGDSKVSDELLINATELILQPRCHAKILVRRPGKENLIETSITLNDDQEDECKAMFMKITDGTKKCLPLERQCFTDVEDALIFCCRFVYEPPKSDSREDRVLTIHSIIGDTTLQELKVWVSVTI